MSLLPLEVLNAGMIDNVVGFKFGTRGHSEGAGSFLGMVCAEINPETGVSHCYFDVEDKHLLFTNQLHGGCTAAFLDTAMPLVVYPFVPTGSWVATMNLNINYLGKIIKGGRQCQHIHTDVNHVKNLLKLNNPCMKNQSPIA